MGNGVSEDGNKYYRKLAENSSWVDDLGIKEVPLTLKTFPAGAKVFPKEEKVLSSSASISTNPWTSSTRRCFPKTAGSGSSASP